MDHRDIAGRFNARFGRRAGTVLIGGAAEPMYRPARRGQPAEIRYTRDYARSALHELAHWCLADPADLELEDYGLAYDPPPRDAAAQARFYAAEVPVQALELVLCQACAVDFRFSADNPGADGGPARRRFERQVWMRYRAILEAGPGSRAVAVLGALKPEWREVLGVAAGMPCAHLVSAPSLRERQPNAVRPLPRSQGEALR